MPTSENMGSDLDNSESKKKTIDVSQRPVSDRSGTGGISVELTDMGSSRDAISLSKDQEVPADAAGVAELGPPGGKQGVTTGEDGALLPGLQLRSSVATSSPETAQITEHDRQEAAAPESCPYS